MKIKSSLMIQDYKRMWQFMRPYWKRIVIASLLTIPIGSLDALIALALKPYMDHVLLEKGVEHTAVHGIPATYIPLAIIVFTLFQGALEYAAAYLNAWIGGKITIDVREKMYAKSVYMGSRYFDNISAGDMVSRYHADPMTACAGLLNNLKMFTTRIFSSISLMAVLIYTSWQLAIVAITFMFCALYPLSRIRRKLKDIAKQGVEAVAGAVTIYTETHAGNKTISAYNLQEYQKQQFNGVSRQIFRLIIKQVQRTGWLSPLMHLCVAFGIAGVIWLGSFLIHNGTMTSGAFVSFITAMLMLYTPVKNIGKSFAAVQLAILAMERIFEILDLPVDIKDKPHAKTIKSMKKQIDFSHVTFEYHPGTPVLRDITLTVRKGETIALVGNSGGGKSTLVNLLPRFYEVNQGSISIDGTDIRDISLASLRDMMAVVFQDNFLFSGTIRSNILLGNPSATEKQIQRAVHLACLDEFLSELPDGLDTFIGDRGMLLSGGQRQRVAIARAFLKDAPIVILDEATSALDNKAEAIVQKAIDNLMRDRTVFVIAHRLSTIQNADKIVVINEGKIVETGSHDALLNKPDGAYKTLYMAQFKGKSAGA